MPLCSPAYTHLGIGECRDLVWDLSYKARLAPGLARNLYKSFTPAGAVFATLLDPNSYTAFRPDRQAHSPPTYATRRFGTNAVKGNKEMKKSIAVRAAVSAVATILTLAANLALAPTTAVMSSNAALTQMAHSDASYVSAVAEMNFASLLSGIPGVALLVALLLIWGSLFFKTHQ